MNSDPSTGWTLHPQLALDTVPAGDLTLCRVLIVNDGSYPWLLLVPRRRDVGEITDLAEPDQARLMTEIAQAGNALRAITVCDKLNVAALGNVVPQLHVHVIARFRGDAAWPKPVWGAVPASSYDQRTLGQFVELLRKQLPLVS